MVFFLICFFLLSILLVGVTTLPVIIIVLMLGAIFYKKLSVFVFAFLSGIILDISLFRPIGVTSFTFIAFLLVTSLYGRKFEIRTAPFVFLSSFLGSILYLWFFGYKMVFIQSVIVALIAVLLFKVFSRFNR